MTDDLVKRLLANGLDECDEAVSRIEELEAENARLLEENRRQRSEISHHSAERQQLFGKLEHHLPARQATADDLMRTTAPKFMGPVEGDSDD